TCARVSPWWRVLCSRGLFSYAPSRPGLYALSLHDALPISLLLIANAAWSALALMMSLLVLTGVVELWHVFAFAGLLGVAQALERSEEHTSELQSRENLVCRLLLEKKKYVHSSPGTDSRYLT